MGAPRLAILGLACRFPDADTPQALWQNALEGRRSFRPLPKQRLDLALYSEERVGRADSVPPIRAGLLTGWSFDPLAFHVPRPTVEVSDLTHWLALTVAGEAIAQSGLADSLDRERTAVVVANTLAGEFSRASLLRLRGPFLDELLEEALRATDAAEADGVALRAAFLRGLRSRFPDPTEDTLAGSLANTIAGRIANHFNFRGGAYSVDGACASSLVALSNAANLLEVGAADAVVVAAE